MRFTTAILLSILFCWGVSSCKKREEKTFTVKIYNPVTDEPYEDIYVAIAERTNTSSGGYVTEESLFFEGYTDASGELTITGEFHKRYAYQLLTGSPEDVPMCHIREKHQGRESGPGLQLDRQNLQGSTAYVELIPCAEFKLKINNVNCQGSSDYFKLFYYGGGPGYKEWYGDEAMKEGGGCYTYSQDYFTEAPMGERYYRWEVTRNNVTETFYDTIYLEEGEQRIYEINY